MGLIDELKIIDDNVKANQAQYDLDIEAAELSALSSKRLDKYKYLIGKDYKPGVIEQVKYEHSPLGVALSKGLDEKDKKRRTF